MASVTIIIPLDMYILYLQCVFALLLTACSQVY